ncbi:MAG: DUF3667 domain-containing protein [Owenweeksia sp.]|nr:DUF3667 domain-containing protein [Owenweeksia sp.]
MAHQKTEQCPNCNQPLSGENYCSNCGQKNDVQRLTMWHMVRESLSNFFSFDGRFFRTLYQLFRYPGKVPHDYMMGKRMRYMHPFVFIFQLPADVIYNQTYRKRSRTVFRLVKAQVQTIPPASQSL